MSKNTNIFNTNNFAPYKEDFQYKQFKPTDGIQSSMYDITMNSNTNPLTKNQAVLIIDSADRDHRKYPNPNKYSIKLKNVYKDVIMVQLKYAQIPNSAYVINETNNRLYFQDSLEQVEGKRFHTVEIPIGNWCADSSTSPSIRSNLEDALNSINDENEYSVIFCQNLRRFTIEQVKGSGIFNLIFCGGVAKTGLGGTITKVVPGVDRFCYPEIAVNENENIYLHGTLGPLLGFLPKNLYGCTSYTSQMSANLNTGRFVVLKIRGMERIDSNNSKLDGAFCLIGMDDDINNFILSRKFDFINSESYTMDFNPPVPEINDIDIEILNCKGDPYDFNGRDHVLMFNILSLSRFDNF